MSVWGKIKSAFRNASFTEYSPTHPFLTNTNNGQGVPKISPVEAMRVATVFACVRTISQTMGSLTIRLVRKKDDGGSPEIVSIRRPRGVSTMTLSRIVDLLNVSPNPRMGTVEFQTASTATLALHGNALIQIRRNAAGDPIELNPIHPALVTYNSDIYGLRNAWRNDRQNNAQPYYTIEGHNEPLNSDEVIHLRGLGFDGIYGFPISNVGREAIGTAQALDINARNYFANASRPSMIWEMPEGRKLTDESYRRLAEGLETAYSGVSNSYKPIVGDAGAKVKFANFSNEQSQLNETKRELQLDIARIFGVPPARIGIVSAQPRANVEQDNIAFVTQTINFYAKIWTSALERALLTLKQRQQGYGFEISTRELTLGTLTDRASAYTQIAALGVLTKNELRKEVLGLGQMAGGEEIALPPNVSAQMLEGETEESNEDDAEGARERP